ncbi:hypothetical protein F4808DRAFT_472788 [Astrocystis sublimbata]|nr:hypothetical protein F4808DRAFT_472788 [Astrocystis sublimbata]
MDTRQSSTPTTETEYITRVFPKELAAELPLNTSAEQYGSLSGTLPSVLWAFAVRLSSDGHLELMRLVFEFNDEITRAVMATAFSVGEQEPTDEVLVPGALRSWTGSVGSWARRRRSDRANSNEAVEATAYPALWQEYRQAMLNSSAYPWLIGSIIAKLDFELPPGLDDARYQIRAKVLKTLDVSSAVLHLDLICMAGSVVLRLPWIQNFLAAQKYNRPIHKVLPDALVVIGSADRALVTVCSQYLEALWPHTGPQILELCVGLLSHPHGRVERTLFDRTMIEAWADQDESMVNFKVTGNVCSLIEVGEAVAWLSAAFNNDLSGTSLAFRYPNCSEPDRDDKWLPALNFAFLEPPPATLAASPSPTEESTPSPPRSCWANLFGDRPVVSGYPIPRRAVRQTGAEMPLGLMAQSVGERTVGVWKGQPLIKGFSSALVPTEYDRDVVSWHYVFNEHGGRLSYTDPRVQGLLGDAMEGLTSEMVDFVDRSC